EFAFPVQNILTPIQRTGKWFYLTMFLLLSCIGWGIYAYLYQLEHGLASTGLSRPIYWGIYMVNFVFFAGISQAGTLISAILRVAKAEWRRPITRCAEVITVFALSFAALSVIIDMGRPDRLLFVMLHGRLQSPILWDISCVNTYLASSAIYLYLPLIPDCAILRDRKIGWTWLYRMLAVGYTGTPKQKKRLEFWISIMAVAIIPIAVSVHTVVAFIFATTLQPGWHSTIFGPLFVVGALYSGIAALMIVMATIRKVFHLEGFLKETHFNNLAIVQLVASLLMIYFTFNIYLVEITGNEPSMMASTMDKVKGQFFTPFWFLIVGGMIFPAIVLSFRKGRSVTGCVISSIPVLIALWLERYLIVVPTLMHPRLPWTAGIYNPTWVEWSVSAGFLAAFVFMYILFTKFFPIISIWEVQEGIEEAIPQTTVRLKDQMPDGTIAVPEHHAEESGVAQHV
ncbi:MAG TPA: NrfD/PsrC family molybdoenzyme membrane anchor subunit, partial [Planctomycetota bacterium]|nr:NrfD/PsrC family molybdoenzyme membrane anchor subunit [Planctomycetota bacterium]